MKNKLDFTAAFILGTFIVINESGFSQQKSDTFQLKFVNGNNYYFSFAGFDLQKRIHLYDDGSFDFESFSLGFVTFSSGQWKRVNDTTIYLQSNQRSFNSVFKRNKRQRS